MMSLLRRPTRMWDAIMSQDPFPLPGAAPAPVAAAAEPEPKQEAPHGPVFAPSVFRPLREARALSATDCPQLHDIYRRLDERKVDVETRLRALTEEVDLLRAELNALAPAWNCMQGWVGIHQIQPVEDQAEEEGKEGTPWP